MYSSSFLNSDLSYCRFIENLRTIIWTVSSELCRFLLFSYFH